MIQSTWKIYTAAGSPEMEGGTLGVCRTCGLESVGLSFEKWVRDTFTDRDKLTPGAIVCHACLFCFAEQDETLTRKVGSFWTDAVEAIAANPQRLQDWRGKTKAAADAMPASPLEIGIKQIWGGWAVPQRFRTYSHFVVTGAWQPLTKGQKGRMRELLFSNPDVAIIADSGKKHLAFRAAPGWWQFEEQRMLPCPELLTELLGYVEWLYNAGANKSEIETGRYSQKTIRNIGIQAWAVMDSKIKPHRGSLPLQLALFLAQKESDGTRTDSE
jgi:hypothetical protein